MGGMTKTKKAIVLDFETESTADLKNVGGYAYSVHPSTDVMCLSWRDVNQEPGLEELWIPDSDNPESLFEEIENGAELWAFNAAFEKHIWQNVMVKKYGWPEVRADQWHCLAALSAYYGYSQNLDRCAAGLSITGKDAEGHKIMLALCNPKKRSKKTLADYDNQLSKLYDYCRQDVDVEANIYHILPGLPQEERKIWLLDQEINDRGIPFDVDLIDSAVKCTDMIIDNAKKLLPRLTDGMIETPGQIKKIIKFCKGRGVELPNLQAPTVDKVLKDKNKSKKYPDDVLRVLEIRQQASGAAVKKFNKAKVSVVDGRFRGGFVYYGAHTGRWTGKGVQPTNMPRMHFKNAEEVEEAIKAIASRDLSYIAKLDPKNPINVLTKSVRPSVTAPDGKKFICGDFAGIELRVLTWLVGDQPSIDRMIEYGSSQLYLDMAEAIFSRPITKGDTYEYTAGKSARLGLGYQMGPNRYVDYADTYDIELSLKVAKKVVRLYRQSNPLVKKSWYAVKKAAMSTLTDGMTRFYNKDIAFKYSANYKALIIRLTSGRELWYPGAFIDEDGEYDTIRYYGDVEGKWVKKKLYGGLIIENIVQALSRDLLCYSMHMLSSDGYDIVSHCYDEIVLEVDESDDGAAEAMTKAMTTTPAWAKGLPLAVDMWEGKRYRK